MITTLVAVGPAGRSPCVPVIAPPGVSTVKLTPGLTVDPTWTVSRPLCAPCGTGTAIEVGEAVVTVLGVPLKSTVFWDAMGLKPVPSSTTGEPGAAAGGVTPVTASGGAACTWNTDSAEVGSAWPSRSSAPAATVSEQRAAKASGWLGWNSTNCPRSWRSNAPDTAAPSANSFTLEVTLLGSIIWLKRTYTGVPTLKFEEPSGGPISTTAGMIWLLSATTVPSTDSDPPGTPSAAIARWSTPIVAGRVHDTWASPLASVRCITTLLSRSSDPAPEAVAKRTATPASGMPPASVARTRIGSSSVAPARPDWWAPETSARPVARPSPKSLTSPSAEVALRPTHRERPSGEEASRLESCPIGALVIAGGSTEASMRARLFEAEYPASTSSPRGPGTSCVSAKPVPNGLPK